MVSLVSHSLNKINPLIILQRREKREDSPESKTSPVAWVLFHICHLRLSKAALLCRILKGDTEYSALSRTSLTPHLIPELVSVPVLVTNLLLKTQSSKKPSSSLCNSNSKMPNLQVRLHIKHAAVSYIKTLSDCSRGLGCPCVFCF